MKKMISLNDRRMKWTLINCLDSIIADSNYLVGLNCTFVENGGVVLATQIVLDCVQ